MKINRIFLMVVLCMSALPSLVYGQSFWLHDQVFGSGTKFVYAYFSVVDSSDCLMSWQSDFQAYTSDYWKSWHAVMEDTPKRPLIKYSYTGFTHPAHNLILIGCNDKSVGHIIRSTDNGTTWKDDTIGSYQKNQPVNFIAAITSLDSNHIVALMAADTYYFPDHVMLSSDGGVNWQSVLTPRFQYYEPSTGLPPNPVFSYPAPNTILVATISGYYDYSTIYRTTDLGITWDSGFQANTTISKFAFINPRLGFASGISYDFNDGTDTATINKTTDGGVTWTPILTGQITAGLHSIAFADSLHGFACGEQGLILQTTDGGNTWNEMTSDFTIDAQGVDILNDVAYPDTNHAMIASSDGSVLVYHPNGILSLPNITYPHFSPPAAPQTFDVTWDSVPGATRYSITITTSGYPDSTTAVYLKDTNITTAYFLLSNLVDTSPPPATGGRQYYIYLQAFNATNQSNVATRIFIVYQGTNGVSVLPKESIFSLAIYPNPTTGLLHIESTSNDIVITDLLGRTRMRAVAGDGAIDVSGLPQGVYSIGDGKSHTQFVKE